MMMDVPECLYDGTAGDLNVVGGRIQVVEVDPADIFCLAEPEKLAQLGAG